MVCLRRIVFTVAVFLVFAGTAFASVRISSLSIFYETENTSKAVVYFQGNPPFTVYRSTDGNNWGTPVAQGLTGNFFCDSGLQNLVNYYYKIQDVDGTYGIAAAYPPTDNVHSSLIGKSELCAACHVTHAAQGAYLIIQPNVVALCTTCHDGSQSKYDVRNGKVRLSTGFGDTSGGPFGLLQTGLPVETAVYEGFESLSAREVPVTPTSVHNLGTSISQAPGGVSDISSGLSCVDCHDPHGVTGNFRNLRSQIQVTEGVRVGVNFQAFARTDPDATSGYGEDIYYNTGSIFFCSACHSDYNQPSGSGSTAATDTQVPGLELSPRSMNKFIHAVNTPLIFRGEYYTSSLPLESGTGVNVVVCLTCHQAHGTFKTGESAITGSTALIRMDRQAICQECHKK